MTEKLLPLGSIVYLEEGTQKLMIVGRGIIFSDEDGQDVYTDYAGVMYPRGIDPKDAIFFNHENIDKTLFRGFEDEEEERFLQVYAEWEKGLGIKKAEV